ncbi:MAG TPA: RluA family pseudouridine synthase [Spirochaetia bacterium]|nr:RluA family pseudouridine synthase [Spirochaetia bacterium]
MTSGVDGQPREIDAPSRLTVGPDHRGLRADAFLALALPFLSRTRVRQKIQTGESLLNGRRCATSARLKAGDVLTIRWRSLPSPGSTRGFEILFEDEHVIALDKPAGIASHPAGRFQAGTVIQWLRERFAGDVQTSLAEGGDFYPRLVNRLDVFTSGVIIAAKTTGALRLMLDLAARAKIGKRYVALVEGRVAQEVGRIDLFLGPDPASSTSVKMAVGERGLRSITDYSVLRRLKESTLLAVFPRTGRQHQVRAHLAAMGHPVWGDLLYRDESLFLRYQRSGGTLDATLPARHCLHAEESHFIHPITGAAVVIRSPLPADFREVLDLLTPLALPRSAARPPGDACEASRSSARGAPAP